MYFVHLYWFVGSSFLLGDQPGIGPAVCHDLVVCYTAQYAAT